MNKIISINNYKGGSGKTTVSTNLVHVLSKDKKVLLIDLDPQSNASKKFVPNFTETKGICDVLKGELEINDSITHINDNLDILTSNFELKNIVNDMQTNLNLFSLKNAINKISDNYDYIIIDNSPAYEILLRNCIYCANYIIVPVPIDDDAIMGVNEIVKTIVNVINETPFEIDVKIKILINMVKRYGEAPNKISGDVIRELNKRYKENIFKTYIHHQLNSSTQSKFDSNYFSTDDNKILSKDYSDLAKEIESL